MGDRYRPERLACRVAARRPPSGRSVVCRPAVERAAWLQELSLVDTTRKRYLREFDENRGTAGTWVSLPGEYALRLVREAVDVSREQGTGLPTRYRALRDVFGEAPGPPERGLIYETISPVEANFNPDWLDDSPRLLGEPEVAGWYVPVPDALRPSALEVAAGGALPCWCPGARLSSWPCNWLPMRPSRL